MQDVGRVHLPNQQCSPTYGHDRCQVALEAPVNIMEL